MSKVLRLNLARILTLLPSPSLNVRRGRRLLTPLIHRLLCPTAGCQLCRLVLLLFSSTVHRTVLNVPSFKRGQFGGFQSCSEPSWCSQLWTWKSAVAGDLSFSLLPPINCIFYPMIFSRRRRSGRRGQLRVCDGVPHFLACRHIGLLVVTKSLVIRGDLLSWDVDHQAPRSHPCVA